MLVNVTWILALLLRDLFSAWRDLEWGGKDATAGATENIWNLSLSGRRNPRGSRELFQLSEKELIEKTDLEFSNG